MWRLGIGLRVSEASGLLLTERPLAHHFLNLRLSQFCRFVNDTHSDSYPTGKVFLTTQMVKCPENPDLFVHLWWNKPA